MSKDVDSDITAQLPSLDRLSLPDVLGLAQPVLRTVIRRCLDEASRPDRTLTAFSNFMTAELL